jgi:hypothetical protein
MMTMMIRRLLICICVLAFSPSAFSQNDDFGIWYGVNAELPFAKKFDFDVSAVLRTFNNASKIEQAYLEGGVSYKFNKYLSLAGSYRMIDILEKDSKYHLRHRLFTDIKVSLPVGDISFSVRYRFQVQARSYIENESDRIPDYHSRLKLKVIYKIPKFPVNPYLGGESFTPMFDDSGRLIDKYRLSLGFEYKIAKKHYVEGEYIFQRDYLPHLADMNIVSISYNIKF